MATLGIPYFLEDKTGLLTSSDFTDVNDRMRLTLRCTLKDSTRSAYMIHSSSSRVPAAALDFGSKGELGTVTINVSALSGVGGGRPHGVGRASLSAGKTRSMKEWLVKVNPFGSSTFRKFVASDGQTYTWNWRSRENFEWTCLNSSNYLVAYYSLKVPGEPVYPGSSGCMLTVDESYPHLAVELLASLIIMRHIAQHDL
ncbi:uncharacterized protein STEHIDRAFT_172050 [Stereum hirsutum FP-91666 SS1]|uniref:uncharacterized protein n=1 Tax=Stereum hirsutum (strain FP-91666) TaxID=721885 RepID=UPI0004449921|nr:uncharacterized protein STEHIDRAFT_172050 [Stereum hirsutum FP-91666 SS1]EIM80982.1 hypothetical protein STEHIDRAFT_172050 [Stereum hirsutum FP-91666 SS1]